MSEFSTDIKNGNVLYGLDDLIQRYSATLMTTPVSFSADPGFGIGLESFIGETINKETARAIINHIVSTTDNLFPEINILSLTITQENLYTIYVDLQVHIASYGETVNINRQIGV